VRRGGRIRRRGYRQQDRFEPGPGDRSHAHRPRTGGGAQPGRAPQGGPAWQPAPRVLAWPGVSATILEAARNWSGWSDDDTQGNSYTQVGASWTVPAISCSGGLSGVDLWVGLDGLTDGTVEQAGTGAQCFDGVPFYYTWWEMYPTNSVQIVGETVSPGDSIYAQVVDQGGGNYSLHVADYSNSANSFFTTQACPNDCADASAEWIAEAPEGSGYVLPLADYGTWSVTAATMSARWSHGAADRDGERCARRACHARY
jgi:hypothetical protein